MISVSFTHDTRLLKQLARLEGELPPATEGGIVDAGPKCSVAWDSETQLLQLRGPRVKQDIPAVGSFQVRDWSTP